MTVSRPDAGLEGFVEATASTPGAGRAGAEVRDLPHSVQLGVYLVGSDRVLGPAGAV